MFKEQLITLAAKALEKASETKNLLQTVVLQDESIKNYLKTLQKGAKWFAEQNFDNIDEKPVTHNVKNIKKSKTSAKKSSTKNLENIVSEKAVIISKFIIDKKISLIDDKKLINGKKTLTYIMWCLNLAKKADVNGLSIHDISALLFKSCNISLYPINISLVINKNSSLISIIDNNNKIYCLSEEGRKLFNKYFK